MKLQLEKTYQKYKDKKQKKKKNKSKPLLQDDEEGQIPNDKSEGDKEDNLYQNKFDRLDKARENITCLEQAFNQ